MKRTFSIQELHGTALVAAGAGLIAATYGLVRLAYGLFLPDIQEDLALDAATAGLISSGGSLMYCIGAAVGFFAAMHHPRLLIVAAGVTAGAGAAGMAAAPTTTLFAVAAITASTGAGLASPALVRIIARTVSPRVEQGSQTIVNAGTGPGLVGAGILALVLLPDWRLAWSLVAVFTALITAAVLVLDRGRAAPVHAEHAPQPTRIPPAPWFAKHGRVIIAALLLGAGSAAIWNFGRTLLVDAGANDVVSIGAWIALGVGGTVVIGTARPMSRLRPHTAWVATALTIAGSTALLVAFPQSTVASLAACAAFGWGYTAATGTLIAWTTVIDPAWAPSGTSLLFVVFVLGQAVGASVIGVLIGSAGFLPAFAAAVVLALSATAVPRRT